MTAFRSLHTIARDIEANWVSPLSGYANAKPYVEAMRQLTSIKDKYYADDAETVVRYFLANASTWRGPVAQRIKAELRQMLPQ